MKKQILLLLSITFLIASCGKSCTSSSPEQEADKILAEWDKKQKKLFEELAPLYDSSYGEGKFKNKFLDENNLGSFKARDANFKNPLRLRRLILNGVLKEIKSREDIVKNLKKTEQTIGLDEEGKKMLKTEEKLIELCKLQAEYYEHALKAIEGKNS